MRRKPFLVFFSVIKALFLREVEMRISIGKSGLFWLFFEPFLQVSILLAIRAFSRGGDTSYDLAVFMASGFIPFNMFRHVLGSSSNAFVANRGLFVYRQVKPVDALVARALVELFLTGMVSVMFFTIGFFMEYKNFLPENTLMVFLSVVWLWIFTIGISLLVAVGSTFFVSIGKIVAVSSFVLLVSSAVFYPIISLPPLVQKILLYNPLTHFMEMIHGFYLDSLDDRFVDYRYVMLWTLSVYFMAFWLYRILEKRIVSE
ncbi:ABC transporter permease [Sulfurovum sp. NBC37-1]|uniref:ABC transporter permease n=1 Tax=Sulfurovum sp. (strain NBC37-1) TaxID=387093 RepID=UPI00015879A1|nr:ABC transporter permease [Sulfurovum sp. NBC37-1]BAF72686.1 capsule polysaccharide export system inner membrane protein [Sulfurovum sp. NBC37-1]